MDTTASAKLDDVDWSILAHLREDGRIPMASLADKVGISRATCYARMERLRTSGVLQGFTARVNAAAAGNGLAAFILISGQQHRWRELTEKLAEIPEVEYCAVVTGEFDLIVQVRTDDIQTLRHVILERLEEMEEVRSTVTIFALDEVIDRPYVLPAGHGVEPVAIPTI